MKKFWNILVLVIFTNFLAMPSIAALGDFDLPTTNIIMSEEESHSSTSLIALEKTVPKTLNVHDFIKFFESINNQHGFLLTDDNLIVDPYHTIFSPPPEV